MGSFRFVAPVDVERFGRSVHFFNRFSSCHQSSSSFSDAPRRDERHVDARERGGDDDVGVGVARRSSASRTARSVDEKTRARVVG